jgi:hypothetical protein
VQKEDHSPNQVGCSLVRSLQRGGGGVDEDVMPLLTRLSAGKRCETVCFGGEQEDRLTQHPILYVSTSQEAGYEEPI